MEDYKMDITEPSLGSSMGLGESIRSIIHTI